MKYSNEELCTIIDAIDMVMDFMISDEESYEAIFIDDSEIFVAHNKLLDLRNEAEKLIWLNTNPLVEMKD